MEFAFMQFLTWTKFLIRCKLNESKLPSWFSAVIANKLFSYILFLHYLNKKRFYDSHLYCNIYQYLHLFAAIIALKFWQFQRKDVWYCCFSVYWKNGHKKNLKFFIKINGMITVNCTKVFFVQSILFLWYAN